jgi:hypothetical protein
VHVPPLDMVQPIALAAPAAPSFVVQVPAAAPSVAAPPAPAPVPESAPTADKASQPAKPADALPAGTAGSRFGGLRVISTIEVQVFENGKAVGSTSSPIALTDGSHALDLVNETLGFRTRASVDVKPGQMTSLNLSVPNGRLSINAVPWASVWIDGTAAGDTPLANVAIPIGSHEIVFKHPQLGDQKQTAVVKARASRASASTCSVRAEVNDEAHLDIRFAPGGRSADRDGADQPLRHPPPLRRSSRGPRSCTPRRHTRRRCRRSDGSGTHLGH